MSIFARQTLLPEVGLEGQARLTAAHVLVVGAGGLGCPVLQYLAAAGVGKITIMDPDHVERSNLHRQPLYGLDDIGRSKAEAAAARLHSMGDTKVTADVRKLGASTATEAVAPVDLVVDAADSFAVSYILSDECLAQGKPLISASALGLQGYVGGFCGGAPSLRAVFPDLPDQAATCASAGVLGPVVGTIGALQAQMVLGTLLGWDDPTPLGQMIIFDLKRFVPSVFRFEGAPEPETTWTFLSRAALADQPQVIELRPDSESPEAASQHAVRALPEDIAAAAIDRDQPVTLCCQSGLRAWRAGRTLAALGQQHITLFAAGAE
ncbi:ThiF family adenylyltransferase [Tritonibacter multivorans]|nr:HesA/MoeB/ThiF family protein [Tritonibacter multivorans]MDA7421089.1 ThiF family adenylyltransferase [Tritonibacter multivorans]